MLQFTVTVWNNMPIGEETTIKKSNAPRDLPHGWCGKDLNVFNIFDVFGINIQSGVMLGFQITLTVCTTTVGKANLFKYI